MSLFSLRDRLTSLELDQGQLVEMVDNLSDNMQESVQHLWEQFNDLAARVVVLTRAVSAIPTPTAGDGVGTRSRVSGLDL